MTFVEVEKLRLVAFTPTPDTKDEPPDSLAFRVSNSTELEANLSFLLFDPTSTSEDNVIPDYIGRYFDDVFAVALEEEFEDGVNSEFSQRLLTMGELLPLETIEEVRKRIDELNPEIVAETLRWLAKLRSPRAKAQVALLVRHCLLSNSPRIRDGAIIASTYLRNQAIIPDIKRAIEKEIVPELRKDMERAVSYLEG